MRIAPQPLLDQANNGQVSPDGRWLAYESSVSGRFEVYAQPFPGPGGREAAQAWPKAAWDRVEAESRAQRVVDVGVDEAAVPEVEAVVRQVS